MRTVGCGCKSPLTARGTGAAVIRRCLGGWNDGSQFPGLKSIGCNRAGGLYGRDPRLSRYLGIITASLHFLAAKTGFGGGSPYARWIVGDAVMPLPSRVCHQQLRLPPIYRGLKLPSGLETWLKGPGAQMGS